MSIKIEDLYTDEDFLFRVDKETVVFQPANKETPFPTLLAGTILLFVEQLPNHFFGAAFQFAVLIEGKKISKTEEVILGLNNFADITRIQRE